MVYLFAFSSFYLQIRGTVKFIILSPMLLNYTTLTGLYGNNGILPAHTRLNLNDQRPLTVRLWDNPTLLIIAPFLGLNVSYCMELLAVSGIIFSFLGYFIFSFFNCYFLFLFFKVGISAVLQCFCIPFIMGAVSVNLPDWSSFSLLPMGYYAIRERLYNDIGCTTAL